MHLDPVHMLILVSKTVFVSVCTPLVAIRFSASAQLVSSNLLFCHGGGGAEEVAQKGDRVEAVDSSGWTALRFAAEFGSVGSEHCACVLLFRGANPNAKDRQGVRVAAKAAERGILL